MFYLLLLIIFMPLIIQSIIKEQHEWDDANAKRKASADIPGQRAQKHYESVIASQQAARRNS